jgi:hypothetical protein
MREVIFWVSITCCTFKKKAGIEILGVSAMWNALSNKKAGSEILGPNAMRHFQTKGGK